MDGWKLAGKLRERGGEAPIFMLSGNAIEDHRAEMSNRLHDEYLIKPVRLEGLLEKIGTALELEWRYVGEEEKPAEGALPTSDELEDLIAMAKIGYLSGVRQKLEALGEVHGDSALLRYLKERAEQCDLDGLVQAIKDLSPPPVGWAKER